MKANLAAIGVALSVGLFAALQAGPLAGAQEAESTPALSAAFTHEQMHWMMDAMHGEATSERLHQTMGPDGEALMDQCVAMRNIVGIMMGTPNMGAGHTPSMGGPLMPSMMGPMMGR